MPRYALVISGQLVRFEEKQNQPPNIPHKNVVWLPGPSATPAVFDPKTQKLTGPTYTINASEVTETWAVVALNAGELTAAKTAAITAINGTYRPLMRALLDHENRIRAKDAPPGAALTLAQYEAAIRDLL